MATHTSTSKATPGPWRVFQKGKVLSVMAQESNEEVVHWAGFDSSSFPTQNSANARLIAAAPDLLSLVGEMVGWVRNTYSETTHVHWYERALATYIKATEANNV